MEMKIQPRSSHCSTKALLFNMEHRRNSKKSKKRSGILKKRVSVADRPEVVVVEKKVSPEVRYTLKVSLIRISLLTVV